MTSSDLGVVVFEFPWPTQGVYVEVGAGTEGVYVRAGPAPVGA